MRKNLTKVLFAITWSIGTSSWNVWNSRLDKYIHTWTWRVIYYLRKCERVVQSERQIISKETHQTPSNQALVFALSTSSPINHLFHHPPYPYPQFSPYFPFFYSRRNVGWSFLTLLKFNFSSSKEDGVWLLGYISPLWAN